MDSDNPVAKGKYSLAVGNGAKALSDFSIALGDGMIATNEKEVVIGELPALPPQNSEWWGRQDCRQHLSILSHVLPLKDFLAVLKWLGKYFQRPVYIEDLKSMGVVYSIAIGSNAKALASFSVALGHNTEATTEGEVVTGEQMTIYDSFFTKEIREANLKWWRSEDRDNMLFIHSNVHTKCDFDKMMRWLYVFFEERE
jgi:hypothetical protein